MKFIDLFSGIGGFRLGMESAGHECVAFCEIDKFARASYKAIHDTEGETEYHDITKVTDEQWRGFRGTVDVICGGFPCQAFSVAGKRLGFLDKTRGTLFFEIARAAEQIKPRFLFLENVKGLLSHERGDTFRTILSTLDELGYDAEWQVLNSKNFGVPQNRERVFIIGHLRETSGREVFPIRGIDTTINYQRIRKIGNIRKKGKSQSGDVFGKDGLAPTLCSTTTMKDPPKIIVLGMLEKSGKYSSDTSRRVYNICGISPTLPTMQGGGTEPKIITGQPIRIDGKRQVNYKLSDKVGTLLASQYKNGDTQPKVVIPVLTPDRSEKRQNGRRFKSDGDEMFTLTAQDRHGVLVKEATKKGYTVAKVGDSVNISHPNSKTRRGRVGKQIANTLLTWEEQAVIVQKARGFNKGGEHDTAPTLSANSWQENNLLKSGFRIRKLTPRECWRLQGFPDWAFDKAAYGQVIPDNYQDKLLCRTMSRNEWREYWRITRRQIMSNSQLYKQAGNSVTVNVIAEIAKRLS